MNFKNLKFICISSDTILAIDVLTNKQHDGVFQDINYRRVFSEDLNCNNFKTICNFDLMKGNRVVKDSLWKKSFLHIV